MTTSTSARTIGPTQAAPASRRTAVILAVTFAVLYVGIMFGGSFEIAKDASGETVIDEFTMSSTAVQLGGYSIVIASALIVFWGAAIRSLLNRSKRYWGADAIVAGTVALAVALVGWVVTMFALHTAVDSGNADVAQAINVLDNANFPPAMLGLAVVMVAVGLTGLRNRTLPGWLAYASMVLGAIAPLGPGGFAPFTLLPLWLVTVSALVRPTEG